MPSSRLSLPILAAFGLALAGCASLPRLGGGSGVHLAASKGEVDQNAARELVSTYRRSHGLAEVAVDPLLERVAQDQALAMAGADKMSHDVHGGLAVRLDDAGLRNVAAVENVSAGYGTLRAAFDGWRRSPPHDANLLNPKMRRMGIAVATAPGSKYVTYWALDMTD